MSFICAKDDIYAVFGTVKVAVREYEASRGRSFETAPTVSGGRVYYDCGSEPCYLKIRGEVVDANPTAALEASLKSGTSFSPMLDGLSFSDMKLKKYDVLFRRGEALYECSLELTSVTATGGVTNA